VRKFFGWALLNAALIGWGGTTYAEENNAPSSTDGDVKYQSSQCDSNVCCCQNNCCDCLGNWCDNTTFFAGGDDYKSIGDRLTNINGGTGSLTSSFGLVSGFNTGFALGDSDLRGQFGGSYGVYDLKGRLGIVPHANQNEQQEIVTAGVYERGDMQHGCDPWSYGVVCDAYFADNWGINANSISLGQLRGIVGYALDPCTEIGTWGTARLWDDRAAVTVAGAPGVKREIHAANQLNGYIRRNTAFGGSFMLYAGAFDRSDIESWQFGLAGEAPLSCTCSLYGNFDYAGPSASAGPRGSGEEQFDVQFGIVYYFGGKAVSPSVTGQRGLPLLDVANNGSFMITD
jgi:hypothetical protein